MPLRNLSLGRKLTVIIMLTSSTTLLLACLAVGIYDWYAARQAMAHDLSTLAAILSQNSSAAIIFGDAHAGRDLLDAMNAEPHILVACLYAKDGSIFARYVRSGTVPGNIVLPAAEGTYFRPDRVVEFRHVTMGEETLGALYLESDLTEMDQRLHRYAEIVMLVVFGSSLVAYLLAFRLQRLVSRPILELVHTTRRISTDQNYALRAQGQGKDELGLLVAGFNDMLEQIQKRDQELERQRAELQREVEARTAMNREMETAKEAAEAASHAKGEFLANMSHEIRTPINGILGMTELVLDTELTQDQRDCLLMAKSSGESLLGLINDILDFSKVESGRMDLEPIEFNLYNSVGETMKALAVRAHQKGLELAYDVSSEVPSEVIGDPGRLRQILVNLVGNAIKFTDHGEVLVEIEKLAGDEHDLELHFRVTDTGIGIPEEKHALLFKAFSQVDTGSTRKYEGTGLGLAISARLVGLMKGKIWLESRKDKGSTFHFTAAFRPLLKPREPAQLAAESELYGVPVLVVDDNMTNRRILCSMVRAWGMRPTPAESSQAALTALEIAHKQDQPFRVILIDACMPITDGFQLAEKVLQRPGSSSLNILMLTSAGRPGEAALCRQLGISAYLLKPVLKTDLQCAILTVMGHRASKSEEPCLVTRHSLRESPRKLRILVAEDNPVNQALVVRVLARMGHSTVVAVNGREALSLVSSQRFDLVFMDVQMPEMDGLTATQAIREMEKESGQHMPIFAMTAYAMTGDRERCLQAGMDGYIAKPVRFSDIEKTLANVSGTGAPAPARAESEHPVWNRAEALERLSGDEELLRELCQIFLRESSTLVEKLHRALKANQPQEVQKAAHSLKGEVSYLAASNAAQIAKKLEEMGRQGNLTRAAEMIALLEQELARLSAAIQESEGVLK
ncbi:MAG TPA: response regulator [Terriglobales bacterium]|nr:response regulator [Terriglobales bacterium]